ncbi:MAG: YceI family protein [Solibacillus sp.]|uniref:YceI family protein n=1 Tax=Solibacillus sp. TaxID=1909654 RepID=UPI0033157D08
MTTYEVDILHSSINFSIKHMMITKVNGVFNSFSAQIEAEQIESFKNSAIRFDLDVASVNTHDNSRDQHLISADFFNADRYPKITFIKKAVEGSCNSFKLFGDLTIKGITNPVVFDVVYTGHVTNPWNVDTYGFSCTTFINRKDFNLTYNAILEKGGFLIDENVQINVELQLNPI